MGKKIYVGNLSYNTTEETLRELFGQYGEVTSVNMVTDRASGRSRGFAFVEMATDEAAASAIEGLNGKMQDDRELKIAEARPREEGRGDSRGGGGERRDGRPRRSRW
jgi:RNA recognition motif-containing protein